MDSLGKQWPKPRYFLILALAAGPIKCCSTLAELRWWVEPFLTNIFAVATPMPCTILRINIDRKHYVM